jgi:hypothetical protein
MIGNICSPILRTAGVGPPGTRLGSASQGTCVSLQTARARSSHGMRDPPLCTACGTELCRHVCVQNRLFWRTAYRVRAPCTRPRGQIPVGRSGMTNCAVSFQLLLRPKIQNRRSAQGPVLARAALCGEERVHGRMWSTPAAFSAAAMRKPSNPRTTARTCGSMTFPHPKRCRIAQ